MRMWEQLNTATCSATPLASAPSTPQEHAAADPAKATASSSDQDTFWHSASHMLGWALESRFGDDCLLADGPSTPSGFFYDSLLVSGGRDRTEKRLASLLAGPPAALLDPVRIDRDVADLIHGRVGTVFHPSDADLQELLFIMDKNASRRSPFVQMRVDRIDAARMFAYSPLKLHLLARISATEPVMVYRCGDFIDLCRGPHVADTRAFRAFKLTRTGASQWRPDSPQTLSRVHGVAFRSRSDMKDWERLQEEAAKRDHRLVGKSQTLFHFSPLSPGAPFFAPHGTRIIQRLTDLLRTEYRRYGFEEVVTPLVFSKALWERSGHWQNYQENMFAVTGCCPSHSHSHDHGHDHSHGQEDSPQQSDHAHENSTAMQPEIETQALKPMNCPGHCLLYESAARSYRDLPIRYAEFSPLHRNEASGALTGLTRVRKFHQDDGHIFCRPDQVGAEIGSSLEFIQRMYAVFKFPEYEFALSTRPAAGYVGEIAQWQAAEDSLRTALESTGRPWSIKEGDGAFYGPKIDISVKDALGRKHQTATIQLDFQLPQRFQLKYQTADGGFATPVMVHRAILGSFERMLAILIEHHGGRWPFWLSPRQAVVVPVRSELDGYAADVQRQLAGRADSPAFFHVDIDRSDHTLSKRVREAQAAQYNFILVVGDKEREADAASVRTRAGEQLGVMPITAVRELFERTAAAFE
ncbi:hypothetical protein HK105_206007 [Polyrhizophydium stewartii]|uniref:threonine--tRNA ligase n=1 Tax=Polyrhizophydium stewartii TaxID=2732419 RepID=A0ABR4N4K6_9FUNG